MDDANSSPTDLAPPPPAYDQRELDQKVSQAVEQSLSSTDMSHTIGEDGWPIYDASAFEVIASSYERSTTGSSSRLQDTNQTSWAKQAFPSDSKVPTAGTQPLRIRRRRNRPSKTSQDAVAHAMSAESARPSSPNSQHSAVNPEYSRDSPPPPFTPTGPSLDGPPFEEVVRLSWDGPDSRPASPLSTGAHDDSPRHDLRESSPDPTRTHHQSLPLLPRSGNRRVNPRPITTDYTASHARHHSAMSSRLDFNPLSAYSKHHLDYTDAPASDPSRQAMAFYNQAVASHLTSSMPASSRSDYIPSPNRSQPFPAPRGASPMPPGAPARGDNMTSSIRTQRLPRPGTAPSSNLSPYPRSIPSPPGANGPSSTFDRQSQYSTETRSVNSGAPWAFSEAQMIRDLYQAR